MEKITDTEIRKIEDDEFTNKEIEIDTSSAYQLELALKTHAQKEKKYHKWYAQANHEVNDLSLNLEITIAEIVEDIIKDYNKKGKTIPPSAKGEIRKAEVPKDPRYKIDKSRLNKAIANKEYLFGLTKAWASRGYRLAELVHLMVRQFSGDPIVYDRDIDSAAEMLK